MHIFTTDQLNTLISKIKGKKIVVVGGCFDILHPGHVAFLVEAKKLGEILIVFLESDKAVRMRKGEERPKNTSDIRATILLEKTLVDDVIILPFPFTDHDYDSLVTSLKPAIIATTEGDPYISHKIRQGRLIGAEVKEVINRLPDYSTTDLIKETI
ncbi:D-glycero-beta-D-manno-heptose 1-phosphate adenylyltransferase [soil metagenome]